MRLLASSLFRWLTVAVYGSNRSRPVEVEFPAASPRHCGAGSLFGTFRGRRAAGCASVDALRPFNNSVNIEDQHEISFIWEKLAAFARRVPIPGRTSLWRLSPDRQNSRRKNILATHCRIFFQREDCEQTSRVITQRLAPGATRAQA